MFYNIWLRIILKKWLSVPARILGCFSSLPNTFPSNGLIFQALPTNMPPSFLCPAFSAYHNHPYLLVVVPRVVWPPDQFCAKDINLRDPEHKDTGLHQGVYVKKIQPSEIS